MCNPNNNNNSISVTEKKPSQTHVYLDLFSLQNPPPPNIPIIPSNNKHQFVIDLFTEAKLLFNLAFPICVTALIMYARSIISMLFLGHLGDLQLAAGSLAIAFANITGYSVLSGLALGMEPLCSQAFGAQRPKLLSQTLHRSIIFLLISSIPISILWIYMDKIMFYLHQDPNITTLARTYLIYSLPDLLSNSFIHPIRIFLRAQGITHPLTLATLFGTILHFPINLLLVNYFNLGLSGVAAASAISNFTVVAFLVIHVISSNIHEPTWSNPTRDCLTGWKPLLKLAGPSCVSVCLEWWWYEIMIVLCGLLVNPKAAVASMGILIQTTSLIYVFPSSLGFAVSTRVGNELGANRPYKAKLSAVAAFFIAATVGLTAAVFAFGLRDKWARMFTSDSEILHLTSVALPILGLCELGNCPQTVGCGVLRGSARPSTAANVNLGAFYLVGMPVAIGLGFLLEVGFCGLWMGLLAAQVCCACLMLYVVGATDWDIEGRRAQRLMCAGGIDATVCSPLLSECSSKSNIEEQQPLICIMVTSYSSN
ncbi:hypothetical protein ACFE04_015478 [Oxalis oulophora]